MLTVSSVERGVERADEAKKPECSYAELIAAAIFRSADGRLSMPQIYVWIELSFPFFRTYKRNWRHSVRHTLYTKRWFVRKGVCKSIDGGGHYWTVRPEFVGIFRWAEAQRLRRASDTPAPPRQVHDDKPTALVHPALESPFVRAYYSALLTDLGLQAAPVDNSRAAWAEGWGEILKAVITCQPYDPQQVG